MFMICENWTLLNELSNERSIMLNSHGVTQCQLERGDLKRGSGQKYMKLFHKSFSFRKIRVISMKGEGCRPWRRVRVPASRLGGGGIDS